MEAQVNPPPYIQPLDVTRRVLAATTTANYSDPLVLLNFSPNTDGSGSRQKLWSSLCTNASKSLAVCFDKPGGVQISRLPTIYKTESTVSVLAVAARQWARLPSDVGSSLSGHHPDRVALDARPCVREPPDRGDQDVG